MRLELNPELIRLHGFLRVRESPTRLNDARLKETAIQESNGLRFNHPVFLTRESWKAPLPCSRRGNAAPCSRRLRVLFSVLKMQIIADDFMASADSRKLLNMPRVCKPLV